jgi:hypothetical protein
MDLNDFLDTLVFWKTTQFHALAIEQPLAPIPRLSWSSPILSRDNYSLIGAPNGASDYSIHI